VKTATDREGHVEDRYNYKLCRNERKSGVLMHVTSLPSPYGIGTMGDEALEFIDFLVLSGQSYWQILPLGATGFGDSPYQSFSSRAGNLYLIDPDELVRKGLLSEDAPKQFDFGDDPEGVDYGLLWKNRRDLLCLAWETFQEKSSDSLKQAFATFRKNESDWLQDYALFMTISGITETGQDIGMIIESVVKCCTIDRNLRVCAVEMFDTFRCGNETDELNVFNLSHFEEIDSRCRRTACREHGVKQDDVALLNVLGQFAVILNGLKRDGIAIQSDMPNFGHRNKIRHTGNHSQAGT
jgi:hypothetical protein